MSLKTSTFALVGAILCAIATFIAVPIAIVTDLPNPGFLSPTLADGAFAIVWARSRARGR